MKTWHKVAIGAVILFVAYRIWKGKSLPFVGSMFKPGGPLTPPAAPTNSGVAGSVSIPQ